MKRRAFPEIDKFLHAMWLSIPYEKVIVLWPSGNFYYLKEYQAFYGEKTGLDVYNTVAISNPVPALRFQQKYWFDPLGRVDAANLARPANRDFIFGKPESEADERVFALVNQQIAENSPVPVIAFDPPRPMRVFLRRPANPATTPDSSFAH